MTHRLCFLLFFLSSEFEILLRHLHCRRSKLIQFRNRFFFNCKYFFKSTHLMLAVLTLHLPERHHVPTCQSGLQPRGTQAVVWRSISLVQFCQQFGNVGVNVPGGTLVLPSQETCGKGDAFCQDVSENWVTVVRVPQLVSGLERLFRG